MTQLSMLTKDQADILISAYSEQKRRDNMLKATEQDFLRRLLQRWTVEKTSADAEALLVYYWETSISQKARTKAQMRTCYSKAAKSSISDITNGQGVKVEDGKLVLAPKRNTKTPLEEVTAELLKILNDEDNLKAAQLLVEVFGGE